METLDVAPAAVNLRAADLIAANGLAHDAYCLELDGRPYTECPVDVLGALAVAAGLHPMVWEDDYLNEPQIVHACEAADLLVCHLGFDPAKSYDETLGAWSDHQPADYIVTMMRAAARQAVTA
jgi:hypothetical protein